MKAFGYGLLLLASSLGMAQNKDALIAAEAACGAPSVNFSTKLVPQSSGAVQPPSGKALVYFIEAQDTEGICIKCEVTVKVGLDGSWQGATNGNSYISVAVDPGEHHVCVNWQSSLSGRSKRMALAPFTAESGKTYYFKTYVAVPTKYPVRLFA